MSDKSRINDIINNNLIDDSNVTVFLFENKKTKNNPISLYTLNVDKDVVAQLKSLCREYTAAVIDILETKKLAKIPEYNPEQEQVVFKIGAKEVEIANVILPFLSGQKVSILYDRNIVNEGKLKAWIIRFEFVENNKIKQMFYFQKFQASKMLGAKRITIFERGNKFKLFKDNILNINLEMDFLLYEETIVVVKKMSAFEKIFGYEEFYINNATQFVEDLAESKIAGLDFGIKLIGVDHLNEKIAKSTRFAHKLYSAKSNEYFKRITFSQLVHLNNRYGFGLQLDKKKKELIINENLDPQVMAEILNDDYGISQLTEIHYKMMGKEMIKPRVTKPPPKKSGS